MLLTKTKEKEILKVYNTWLQSYLSADIETYDSFLDDDYHFIGSTDNEEFLTRKDTTNFFKSTAKQFADKTELRKETTTLEQFGELIFVTHIFDAWFLKENDWTYDSRFRFSSILQEKKEGWKFIYQHFSIADSKADVSDSTGYDKVNTENVALRETIKRRTFELEEKKRELEVEGALERIRAQAVAMQQSSDLLDIVVTMRTEFIKLGHEAHYFWHMMWLPNIYEKAMTSGDGTKIGFVMELPRHIHSDIPILADWEKSKKSIVVYPMNVEEAIDYVDKMISLGDFQNIDPQAPTHDAIRHIGGLTFIMARTSHGEIGYSLPSVVKNPPKEDLKILEKFAGAFDLAHRRFLDLQKAEKQAREVQIELALEKVRSRTMAMQNSKELADTASVLFAQIKNLGFDTWSSGFCVWAENEQVEAWMGANSGGLLPSILLPYKKEKTHKDIYKSFLNGDASHERVWDGEALKKHYQFMQTFPTIKAAFDDLKEAKLELPDYQCYNVGFFKYGYLLLITKEQKDELADLSIRFANVFEQTYTRFLDLQKAEAQARESEIELALERIRAKTMSMQHSDELSEAAADVFKQIQLLGIHPWSFGFNIFSNNYKTITQWVSAGDGRPFNPFKTPATENVFSQFTDAAKRGAPLYVSEIGGKELVASYEYMSSLPGVGELMLELKAAGIELPTFQVFNLAFFKQGYLMFITYEQVPEAQSIFKRFAKVFEQTYTRFLDLQKVEAQVREAQIEMALEKVRSKTIAMQHSDDLHQTAKVMFSEIQALGIPFWSCGYNLLSDDNTTAQSWMSTQGGIQEVFTLEFKKEASFMEMYAFFESDDSFLVQELGGKALESSYTYMKTISSLGKAFEECKQAGIPMPTYQINHLCKFNKGYLLFITYEKVPEAHNIFNRFTIVFEQTYTRFNDLKLAEANDEKAEQDLIKLQAAKKSAEEALSELQLTQTQLIQSEKMASLGELTAGIAHEIQNPLNFVNNFSEVNTELIEEMKEELDKGNLAEVQELANDISENEKKIMFHGKRADSIVKGMLQHSRTSNGKKEWTNINALADEYLRLAYHGLRAKDTSFNADMHTNFDKSIKSISVISQDIGRVILNLVTNAFYAVNEKSIATKDLADTAYKPHVAVGTKKKKNSIEIIVTDNGNGVPETVKEKIFQPFFTTKPTGQGTGLGLSMSYDIVTKGHGGELKVETKEGKGTTFIIQLPNSEKNIK